jgi:hypothetical protein
MSLITIVVSLIVVGVLLWLVNTYIPMDGKIKKIINIVVVVVVVLWLLNVFGVTDHLRNLRVSIQSPSNGSLASQPGLVVRPTVPIIGSSSGLRLRTVLI